MKMGRNWQITTIFTEKKLDQVMDELVDKAADQGYLQEGGRISLTLDARRR